MPKTPEYREIAFGDGYFTVPLYLSGTGKFWGETPWFGRYAPRGVPVARTPDELRAFFESLSPGEPVAIHSHGDPKWISATFADGARAVYVSPDDLGCFEPLKAKRPVEVALFSCSTGAGRDNFAQKLSAYLRNGIPVIAPRHHIHRNHGLFRRYINGEQVNGWLLRL